MLGVFNFSFAQIFIMDNFELGSYGVGFKHQIQEDYSRAFGKQPRPVEMFIWYPSNEKTNKTLNYFDYLLLNNTETNKGKGTELDSLIIREIKKLKDVNFTDANFSRFKNLKTIAQKEAPLATGSFPLIIIAPGGNTHGRVHSVLAEYLASFGYIVIANPSLGNNPGERWPFNQTGLNLQIEDMSFSINYTAQNIKAANVHKICLISWSVGGVSQGIYSMKNPNIDMFISLDSGLGREYGIQMIKQSPYFNYSNFKIPYLHITGEQPEIYNVPRSKGFSDSVQSKINYKLLIEPFAHQHFASQSGIIPALASDPVNKDIAEGYVKMCLLTKTFIGSFLTENNSNKLEWKELTKPVPTGRDNKQKN